MRARIQRWGHSLAVRIPKPFAAEAKLEDRGEVDIAVSNGKIVIAPAKKPAYRLEDLLSRVTKSNIHDEEDFGGPVGKEAW